MSINAEDVLFQIQIYQISIFTDTCMYMLCSSKRKLFVMISSATTTNKTLL